MKNWFRRSIENKLTALVLVAVVPSVLLTSLLSEWGEISRRVESKRREFAGIAAAIAASASEPLSTGDHRQTANALKGIGSIPGILHVSVTDAAGHRKFQFGAGILVSEVADASTRHDHSSHLVATSIVHGGRDIGRLTLIGDLRSSYAGFYRGIAAAILAALGSALAGLLLSRRMQRAIADPIARVTSTMRLIAASRNFGHRIDKTTSDEIGVLVESFNAMLSEIRTRDGELALYHAGLERLVEERTRELAVATHAAERANAAKSEFLATMSHEIRTPMNGMLVTAELLAASDLAPRARRQCEVILRSGQTLLAIINDILDLSKIEAERMTLESVPLDPVQLVEDTLHLFAERASSKGLQLASYIAPGVPDEIDGDPVRLGQVLSNLVNNALKFTDTGGVVVRLERVGGAAGGLRFRVADTGIGIAEDKVASIFEPFTQAEQSTTRRYGGTGIGLTICRRLVEAMGGEIRVRSAVGDGSEFSFEIALPPSDEPIGARPEARGKALLVVEAGPIRDVLRRTAADLGLDTVVIDRQVDADADVVAGTHVDVRLALIAADAGERIFMAMKARGWPVIALSAFGDGRADQLLREGVVRDVVELPLCGNLARAAMIAALDGSPPIAEAKAPPAEAAEHKASYADARILAADDSALNREVLREALSRLGAAVTLVEDGAAAVEALRRESFDLVFMDGSMPVMDGFAATRAIRAWEQASGRQHVPIIGLSAHVPGLSGELWQDCGMSGFITKPFTLGALRGCLERWLEPTPAAPPVGVEGDPRAHAGGEAVADHEALLDPTVLDSIAEMQAPGDDLIRRVVGLYIEHAPRAFERLAEDVARGAEAKSIAAAAHALKSLSRNVGARRVGDLCGEIEDDARRGLAPRTPLTQVETALGDTVRCIRQRCDDAASSADISDRPEYVAKQARC